MAYVVLLNEDFTMIREIEVDSSYAVDLDSFSVTWNGGSIGGINVMFLITDQKKEIYTETDMLNCHKKEMIKQFHRQMTKDIEGFYSNFEDVPLYSSEQEIRDKFLLKRTEILASQTVQELKAVIW